MTAAILFLFLLVGSANTIAADLNYPAELVPSGNINQPLLRARSELSEYRIPTYRGGAEDLINSTVAIATEGGHGAGVVLDQEAAMRLFPDVPQATFEDYAFIVSNFHVVSEGIDPWVAFAPRGKMSTDNSEIVQGEIIAVVPSKDLALISVTEKPEHVQGASLGNFKSLRIGDDVEAVGHPLGELWTYTRGYVSQLREGYTWKYNDSFELSADVIQTQTPISPGNSGGPLFSRDGKLIGINSFLSESGQNLNFAVALPELNDLAEALMTKSLEVQQVSKLLNWGDLPRLMAENYKLTDKGRTDDENLLYQLYELRSDSDTAIVAFFGTEDSPPLLVYEKDFNGTNLTILLDANHDNAGAYFYVEIVDEAGETIATGWDFDGDFGVDYLL